MNSTRQEEARSPSSVSFKAYGGSAPENYERYFVPAIGKPFATDLLEVAALRPGERVLDVACGTGVMARLAAERVGTAGAVAGLDVNPGMLAVAGSVTPPGATIEWHEGSAVAMPLPDETFDVVLCSLGIQFFPDKLRSVREMHRVLSPHGRLAINGVGPTPQVLAVFGDALARHVKLEAAAFVEQVFSLYDPDEVQRLLEAADFCGVTVRTKAMKLTLPAPKEFLWQYAYSTPLAGALQQIEEERRAALERDVLTDWQRYVEDGSMVLQSNVVVATARKE